MKLSLYSELQWTLWPRSSPPFCPRLGPGASEHCTVIRGSLWNYWHSLGVLDTGRNKNSAHSKMKREDWTGTKKEKVGQLCPSTETGVVQGWAMVDSWCQLHSFNQAINDCIIAWSHSSTKKHARIGSYQQQISFIALAMIEDWISLSSGYHNSILKDMLYREQVGRVWKWVILICVGSKPFLTCLPEFLSIH